MHNGLLHVLKKDTNSRQGVIVVLGASEIEPAYRRATSNVPGSEEDVWLLVTNWERTMDHWQLYIMLE